MASNRGGRAQDPAVDAAIRASLSQLLTERGLDLTYDDVAAHAGVGRTTLFRRYPTKQRLLLAGFAEVSLEQMDVPDTGSVRTDLSAVLNEVMRVIGRPELRRLLRQAIGEACREPAFTDLLRAVLDARMGLIDTVLDRGSARGELTGTTDRRLMADMISGVIAVRLITDTALPATAEIGRLADAMLEGCRADGQR